MSTPDSVTPSAGASLRTAVPLATSSPSRTPISPANIPPRLSAKLSPSLDVPPPLSLPTKTTSPKSSISLAESSSMADSASGEMDTSSMSTSPDNLLNYAFQCGMQAIPALALGVIIDKILHKLQTRFDLGPLLMIVIQFIVIVVVLFILEKYIAGKYAAAQQMNTPGVIFYVFFFGIQFNLFQNLKKLKKIVFDENQ